MVFRAYALQLYALIGNICLFPFYYWVLRPMGASDNLILAFSATIPLAYIASTAMIIWDEVTRNEAGCVAWFLMIVNLFAMALNMGAAVALSEYS